MGRYILMATFAEWFDPLSDWFNRHKGILVVIGMPIGAAFTYAANNVVYAQDFNVYVQTQTQHNEAITKAISVLDYKTQLTEVRIEIDHLLDGVTEVELGGRDKRKLERLQREEQRLESLLAE